MHSSTDFHSQFASALQDSQIDSQPLLKSNASNDQRRRFNIYRNNRAVSLIDNLHSTYPAIYRLVGEAFFKAAARSYIDLHPPTGPVMSEYGGEFGQFLAGLPNTGSVPYLQDMAQLEWHWLQSYHSGDCAVLSPDALAGTDTGTIMDLCLQCHPALFTMKSRWPIGSIWTACTQAPERTKNPPDIDMTCAESVVITRPELQVSINIVPESGQTFLAALKRGMTIGDAAELALAVDVAFDAGHHLTGLLSLGAFSDFEPHGKHSK